MTIKTANLGFPRIGRRRELKFALERYWAGKASRDELLDTGARLRAENWAAQKARGIDVIPPNDFSFYDHVLDTAVLVGAIPPASRRSRRTTVLASCTGMDFKHRIAVGSIIEPVARIVRTGRSSATVEVELWSEELLTGRRQRTVAGTFVMVAVDGDNRPVAVFAA